MNNFCTPKNLEYYKYHIFLFIWPFRSRSRSRSDRRYKSSRYSHSHSRSPGDRRSLSHSPMSSRRRHMGTRDNPKPSRCLGVFGLSVYTTEDELYHIFSKYGPLERVQVVIDAKVIYNLVPHTNEYTSSFTISNLENLIINIHKRQL